MTEIGRVRTVLDGFNGGPGVSTTYFAVAGDTSWAAQLQPILDAMVAAWDELVEQMPVAWTYEVQAEVDIINVEDGELTTTLVGTAAGNPGQSAFGYTPIASGMLVNWLTNGVVAGKHVRGRTFLVPFGNAGFEANGSPNGDAIAACEAFGAAVIAADGASADPVVWSRPRLQLDTTGKPVVPHVLLTPGSAHIIRGASVPDEGVVLRSRRD